MPVNPFAIAKLYKTVEQGQRSSKNLQRQDKMAAGEFVGQETEVAEDMMRAKEREIAKLLGKEASGMGALGALGTAASMMNPLAGGIVSGLTSLMGGSKQRKHALRQIKAARAESIMPEKYAKSWMGKKTKGFEHGYATELDRMKAAVPSKSDIFKSALMSGAGTYIAGGGKSKMTELRGTPTDAMGYSIDPTYGDMSLNVNTGAGLFAGGLDFTGGGVGTNLFGGDSILNSLFSGDASKEELMQLAPLLQLLKLGK